MITTPRGAVGWWRLLQPDTARERKGDRAALARLRRCATVAEAMQEPPAIRLFGDVGATGRGDLPTVALAAAVLAHLRAEADGIATVARAIGPESVDRPETALLKPLRFRRLLEASGPDETLTAFRRLVALAGGKLPLADLAASLLNWDEDRRRRWIYDYWNAGQPGPARAAPDAAATPHSEDHAG